MPDLPPIQSPMGPLEPKKDASQPPSAAKFEQYFKVGESEAKQKKKGKKREEDEAKKKIERTQVPEQKKTLVGGPDQTKRFAAATGPSSPSPPPTAAAPPPPSAAPPDQKIEVVGPGLPAQESLELTPAQKAESDQELAKLQAEQKEEKKEEISLKKLHKGEEISKKAEEAIEKKKAQRAEEEEEAPLATTVNQEIFTAQQQATSEKQKEDRKKIAEKEALSSAVLQTGAQEGLLPAQIEGLSPSNAPPPPYLDPKVWALVDQIVGAIIYSINNGEKTTTVLLNVPPSHVLHQTEITIREFSTAPLAYNVQINGTAQAIALIDANLNNLRTLFDTRNYKFKIHRLETGYVRRKENLEESGEE